MILREILYCVRTGGINGSSSNIPNKTSNIQEGLVEQHHQIPNE